MRCIGYHECILSIKCAYTSALIPYIVIIGISAIDNIFSAILNVLISTFFVLDCFFVFLFSFFFLFFIVFFDCLLQERAVLYIIIKLREFVIFSLVNWIMLHHNCHVPPFLASPKTPVPQPQLRIQLCSWMLD